MGESMAFDAREPSAADHATRIYGLEAEDLMAIRIFYGLLRWPAGKVGGFVDIGACRPIQSNNTWLLYNRGWRGVNVDANPDAAPMFARDRPEDIMVTAGVSAQPGVLAYTRFSDPLLNGFLSTEDVARHEAHGIEVLDRLHVTCRSPEDILTEYTPPTFDLLNIDVEGMEDEILSNWDFGRWRPSVAIVEIHAATVKDVQRSIAAKRLEANGYELFSRLWHSSIFIRADALKAAFS